MSLFSGIGDFFSRFSTHHVLDVMSKMFNPKGVFRKYVSETDKIEAIFNNPAVLKVFALQCDLFSLGEVYVYKGDQIVAGDIALTRINNPNPMQSKSQFLWDLMFYNMLGTAYCYVYSDSVTNDYNKLYLLESNKIEWPDKLLKAADKLVLSKAAENDLMSTELTYRYKDGSTFKFKLKNLIIITDLTNGANGNWFKGPSRIDALYKIIQNSDATLDSKNINVRYAGKFIVAGTQDPNDVNSLPLSEKEKGDIETKVNGPKQVHAFKSMIDIKRFVENLDQLKLGAAYLEDYFLIGSMYGIPRDVLEAYNSATYENQEKARAAHVSYTLQPKGNQFMNALSIRWGYPDQGLQILMDWSHLPFMQVFEKDRAQTKQTLANTFTNLIKNGVSPDDANKFLDTDFKKVKANEQSNGQGQKGQQGSIKSIQAA